jgi:hypothetical protein
MYRIMTLKRTDIKDAIKKDYPSLPEYFVNLVLDMHEQNPEWFKEDKKASEKAIRKGRKPKATPEIQKEYVGSIEVIEPKKDEDVTVIDLN